MTRRWQLRFHSLASKINTLAIYGLALTKIQFGSPRIPEQKQPSESLIMCAIGASHTFSPRKRMLIPFLNRFSLRTQNAYPAHIFNSMLVCPFSVLSCAHAKPRSEPTQTIAVQNHKSIDKNKKTTKIERTKKAQHRI